MYFVLFLENRTQLLGRGHTVQHERWQSIDCTVLILSQRVIMAIRTSRPIKAEGVCAGRTCQCFINKVNHRPRSHQSRPKKGQEAEESLGHLTLAPLQRSTVIKGTSTLEFTFPIKGPPTTVGLKYLFAGLLLERADAWS